MNLLYYLFKFPIFKILKAIYSFIPFSFFFLAALIGRYRNKTKYIFGGTPHIVNTHWAESISNHYETMTLVSHRPDKDHHYDRIFIDFIPKFLRRFKSLDGHSLAFIYVLLNAKVLHISFDGFAFKDNPLEKDEPYFLKIARIKTIILPYGRDCRFYSRVHDLTLRHALICENPNDGLHEETVNARVKNWLQNCDAIIPGTHLEGIPYWSLSPFNMAAIDPEKYKADHKKRKNDKIIIAHIIENDTPKAIEFLEQAIKELQNEGRKIELLIIKEGQSKRIEQLQKADILVDQLINGTYGLAAVEGMSMSIPVLSDMSKENYNKFARRYGFLSECPILSTTIENCKEHIEILLDDPNLRDELGKAGRSYVKKYHSYEAASFVFNLVYAKLFDDKDINLMNIFHPLKSDYMKGLEKVQHPLIKHNLPLDYLTKNKKLRSA